MLGYYCYSGDVRACFVQVDKLGQGRHPCIRMEVWIKKCERRTPRLDPR